MSRPVFIVGLDGATWTVLDALMACGDMPTLARLVSRGARGTLRSVVPPITPAAWSSFMTGKRPGKHGIYDFRVYDPRRYGDTFVTSRALHERTVWELCTAAGRRVAVVNLPVMYPPDPRAGTVVSGFDTPSVAAAFTHPPELRARILERMPDYALVAVPDPSDPTLEHDDRFDEFVGRVERGFEQRTRVALDLLADGAWDVFMVHYQEVDILQHRAWRFIADATLNPRRSERIRRAYRRLDEVLADVLAAAPSDALVLVVSDHGFGAHGGRVYPNVLLQKWGYLSWRGRTRGRVLRSIRKRLRRIGLGGGATGKAAEPWIRQLRVRGFDRMLPLRWRRTRAYVALAEMYGLLFVNLRGREPQGVVAPGAAYEALVGELRERFLAVRDPADGAPLFSAVVPGREVYPDDPRGGRPDLVLVPRPEYSVYRDLNYRLWVERYTVVSGTHRPEGIIVAGGSGVRAGALPAEAELIDVAPTILAAAGVPVPTDMDGRVLTELFVEPPAVSFTEPTARPDAAAGGLSADEEGEVVERLRALGYMT